MPPRSAHSEAVVADLLVSAIELIRDGGVEGVTVRALAHKSHYSPSTIGYHTVPFDQFVDRVWRKVGIDLARSILGEPQGDDWAPPAARRLLAWHDENPLLAQFFVSHAAVPPDGYGVDEWSFLHGMSAALPADRTLAVLSYLARRFQLALEHALRWPEGRPGQERVLADELLALDAEWRRFIGRPSQTTGSPGADTTPG